MLVMAQERERKGERQVGCCSVHDTHVLDAIHEAQRELFVSKEWQEKMERACENTSRASGAINLPAATLP